ncbi:flavanone 3-dioxygenase-like [Nymphaea colorata]|nr:flavanone 3-dioxygenase-like [Nymphaea colorata]
MAPNLEQAKALKPFLPSLSNELTVPSAFIRNKAERPKVAHDAFSNDVPVISFADIDSADSARRSAVFENIVDALENWGIFQVIDHGVDPTLVSSMADLSTRFFQLPAEEKLRFEMTAGKHGGYIFSNHMFGEEIENWREFFTFFSYPVESRDSAMWPEQPKGWREVVDRYCEANMKLASRILEVLSESMGLEKGAFKEACLHMDQKVLVNFYPRCPQPELALGLRRHTDPGTITILLQDLVGGLQITRDGGRTWLTVKPIDGAFVINLGEHARCLSNGRFAAVEHQVVVNSNSSRLSIGAFQYPAQDALVYPLKLSEGEKPLIEKPVTFKEMYTKKMQRDVDVAMEREKL